MTLYVLIIELNIIVGASPQSVVPFGTHPTSTPLKDRTNSYKEHGTSPYERRGPISPKSHKTDFTKFAQSPSNMEGPISFIGPELAEETLMNVSFYFFPFIMYTINISHLCLDHNLRIILKHPSTFNVLLFITISYVLDVYL